MYSRIMFLRNSRGFPVGCLAIDVDHFHETVSYQYSVLNPTDKFNREVARVMALGRLVKNPIEVPHNLAKALYVFTNDKVSMHKVSAAVMSHLAASKAPSRAVKAACLWAASNKQASTEKV